MKNLLLIGLMAGAALVPSVASSEEQGAFTIQESGQSFASLGDAVAAVGDGNATILIAPGQYRQCAVQEAGRIAYVAQVPGTVVFDGVACEGKAALVLRGQAASINGLTFQNIRVPDENGAGIRLEQGNLVVAETMFRDSQSGILSGNDPQSSIRIDRSTFSGLGLCANDCAHSIYIGDYGRLIVTRSRFERGTGGHYVKTRGAQVEVTDSSFDDSHGKATNYMIDLPNGSVGIIARNTFVQGAAKENYSALIMVAAEGAEHSSEGLQVTGNEASLAPGAKPTSFVVDDSGQKIELAANRLGPQIEALERR